MDYSLKLLYENLNNGKLVIGKYTLVDGVPIKEYDYTKDRLIISPATRKNLEVLEKKAGAVFTKIYRADKSKHRGAYSTYILGTMYNHPDDKLNGREFIWARPEQLYTTATVYFDDHKIVGSMLVKQLSKTITKVGDLYKIEDEQNRSVIYRTKPRGGIVTRDDGPSILYYYPNGTIKEEQWVTNGRLNRNEKEGPAVIGYNRSGEIDLYRYLRNGEYHRSVGSGPAVEHPDGYKVWYSNGVRHRLDGPAIEYADGYATWYVNGNFIFQTFQGIITDRL